MVTVASAEAAVIGALMLMPELVDGLEMSAGDFLDPHARTVWDAILALRDEGIAVDEVTVSERVTSAPTLAWMSSAVLSVPTADNLDFYADVCRRARVRREAMSALSAAQTSLKDGDETAAVISNLHSKLDSIAAPSTTTMLGARDAVLHELRAIERDLRDGTTPGIPTGISKIDRIIGGIPFGVPTVLAARPAVGKTSLLINIACHAAEAGCPVYFATFEDRAPAFAQRLMARRTGVSVSRIRGRTLDDSELLMLSRANVSVAPKNLWIEHCHGIGARRLNSRIRAMRREHGVKLVIVDYLQLMGSDTKQSRFDRVSDNAEVLAEVAGKENIAVVVASQLNRESARESRAPGLHDLRDSGVIEQVAKLCIALSPSDDAGLWLHVLKNSQGELGDVLVNFNKSECRVS